MPQLSPINWLFLFILFWLILMINSSIMWWNTTNMYKFNKNIKKLNNINYKWFYACSYFFFFWWP
uniref:ATP synthase F0 subunit 8 n=1 Tax=Acanthosepion pharaonis TaxID=158019 RepID=M9V350_ACAPH|nr:ATP synthase F0 subunit 8 [Sepia pharaonis]AGJ71770.1 ATP synthase F0 subunit 8 [Sepia pharaonis]